MPGPLFFAVALWLAEAWLATAADNDLSELPEHCQGLVDLDFSHGQLVHNNLGGLGPHTGEPVIAYAGIGRMPNGNPITLVVSNTSRYLASGVNLGFTGALGKIDVAQGSSVKLKFSFTDAVTHKLVKLQKIFLSFLDIDQDNNGRQKEYLATCGASAYYLSESVESIVEAMADTPRLFCMTFRSTHAEGDSDDGMDEPVDPSTLTDIQMSKGVSLQYSGVSEVDLELAVGGLPDTLSSRSFLFAGSSLIDGCIPIGTSTTTTTLTATITSITTSATTSSTSTTSSTTTITTTITTTTSTTTTITTTTITTTTPLRFWNCLSGPVVLWSGFKADWCCKHEHIGCPTNIDAIQSAKPLHLWNCFNGEVQAWPQDKRDWCCQHENRGCTVEPYDCRSRQSDWGRQQQHWCCRFKHLGCVEAPSCTIGSANWETVWSDSKKEYCCQHTGLGCNNSLALTNTFGQVASSGDEPILIPAFQTAPVKSWNCFNGQIGAWTEEKKTWCCSKHEELGCSEATAGTELPGNAAFAPSRKFERISHFQGNLLATPRLNGPILVALGLAAISSGLFVAISVALGRWRPYGLRPDEQFLELSCPLP